MNLTFCGGTKMVSGSSYLLESSSVKILVDCGLHQGSNYCERLNFEPFLFNPKEIDTVLITHAHIDHIGRLPQLYKAGFRGQIISTPPTKDFAELLLLDSEHILNKEAAEKNLPPLYDIQDVNNAMTLWKTIKYHEKFRIKNLEIEFYNAGHILGSSFINISSDEGKRIVFSGDLGNVPAPIIKETDTPSEADYALIESAYGNRVHEDSEKRKDLLEDIIEETFSQKGVLMIPAFAMERTQELLFELNELVENKRIPRVPIFIDSPLAIKLTEVYKKYSEDPDYFDTEALTTLKKGDSIFNFSGLRLTLTTEQSKEINDVPAPKVVIAGSGMSHGGRILHHEIRYLPDPKSTLLFIGYQAVGSLGRQILDGAKKVRIMGQDVAVKCRIQAIGGYSAHADQTKLLKWLEPMKLTLKKIFIVQGEEDQMVPFSQKIMDEFAIPTEIPSLAETVVL